MWYCVDWWNRAFRAELRIFPHKLSNSPPCGTVLTGVVESSTQSPTQTPPIPSQALDQTTMCWGGARGFNKTHIRCYFPMMMMIKFTRSPGLWSHRWSCCSSNSEPRSHHDCSREPCCPHIHSQHRLRMKREFITFFSDMTYMLQEEVTLQTYTWYTLKGKVRSF